MLKVGPRAAPAKAITVVQNALLMIGLQHPGRAELKDVDFQLFEKYKDYLLGDCCCNGLSSNEAAVRWHQCFPTRTLSARPPKNRWFSKG